MTWLLSAMTITYMWLLGRPRTVRLGWLLCVVDNVIWTAWAWVSGNYGLIPLSVVCVVIGARNFALTQKEK